MARPGFTLFLTGLSGAGKSTLANLLSARISTLTGRPVTLLDGDVVRRMLSSELGFSKDDRNLNIARIGFVASEVVKHRGIAICAAIAPYEQGRRDARRMVSEVGTFVEVYVATPLEVCEERDPKGLYAKARKGCITGFTGIDDPYEPPTSPELTLDTSGLTPDETVESIVSHLKKCELI